MKIYTWQYSTLGSVENMTNYYEKRLQEITAMLHLEVVQKTDWMKEKLETERDYILHELRDELK